MSVIAVQDCLFCRIVSGELPSSKVYESEHVIAFHDIQPLAPIHILVIPRTHVTSVNVLHDVEAEVLRELATAINGIATEQRMDQHGYRVVTNVGEWGGQTVNHLHFHLLGGRQLGSMG